MSEDAVRSDDLNRLGTPYATDQHGQPVVDLANALGCRLGSLRDLRVDVLDDLDPDRFGIRWWKVQDENDDQLRRRIVVSDYLVSVIEGVEHALIDLELHRLELFDHLDRESEFLRRTVERGPRGWFVRMRPRLSPSEELAPALVDLHLAGMLRAAATSLDCVAGVIAIVGAIRTKVLRTGWNDIDAKLDQVSTRPANAGAQLQLQLKQDVAAAVSGHRGSDWIEWLLDYRNLMIHRGHRLKLSSITPVLTPSGQHLLDAYMSPTLLSDPEVTDVEALGMAHQHPPVLEEDGRRTIAGLRADIHQTLEDIGAALLRLWRRRRTAPSILPQPVDVQWPTVRRSKQHFFAGYQPGSHPFNPSSFTISPTSVRRWRAASLSDPSSALWGRE